MPTRVRALSMATLFVAALLAAPAPASGTPRIWVPAPPPPPVVEVRPVAPSRRHVWAGGYHRWDGRSYVWVPGTWRRAPRARAAWAPGRWVHGRRGWYWVDGRWR
ncbi:MAG: hypothetical protein M3S32_05385 [Acidobacteriota bacterium]|nr:hypothetical protein [Acidobacteriota bacterium]